MTARILPLDRQPKPQDSPWAPDEERLGSEAFREVLPLLYADPDALYRGLMTKGAGRSADWIKGYFRAIQKIVEHQEMLT